MEDAYGTLFYQKDLYQPLSGKTKKPMSMTGTEWDILDIKALGTIQLCLVALVAFNISRKRKHRV